MKNIGRGEGWEHRMPDAATNITANITVCPVHDHPASAWDALPYLYLLRVQLITFLALLSFPFLALWFAPNRFHIRPFPFGSSLLAQLPTRVGYSPVFALFSLPVILTAMYVSKNGGTSTYLRSLLGALGGAVLAAGILVAGGQFQRPAWLEA